MTVKASVVCLTEHQDAELALTRSSTLAHHIFSCSSCKRLESSFIFFHLYQIWIIPDHHFKCFCFVCRGGLEAFHIAANNKFDSDRILGNINNIFVCQQLYSVASELF